MDRLRLQRLFTWLEIKLQSMDKSPATDDYSELNLSKEILAYLKYSVDRELEVLKVMDGPQPSIHLPTFPYQTHTTTQHTTPYKTETICEQCKARNPQNSHCIHKMIF